jgi:hypothetical protein
MKKAAKYFGPISIFGLLLIFSLIDEARPHGRLIEPPSRSTMWR